MIVLYDLLQYILTILSWIIIIQAILSWLIAFNIINMQSDFVRQFLYALDKITEPVYRPIRKILPDFGALDLSPLVVLLIISFVQRSVLPAIFSSFG